MIWAGVYIVKDGFSLPALLRETVFAEEHVDIGVVNVIPRVFFIFFFVKENVENPSMTFLER